MCGDAAESAWSRREDGEKRMRLDYEMAAEQVQKPASEDPVAAFPPNLAATRITNSAWHCDGLPCIEVWR
jgi:hypothetical protein